MKVSFPLSPVTYHLSPAGLIVRSLRYYWRTGVVVVFGLAIATAVIVGSLLIGDSVKGSIRDTATARLGRIDQALVAPHFFRARLADDLSLSLYRGTLTPIRRGRRRAGFGERVPRNNMEVVLVIVMRGAAESTTTEAVLPSVGVIGIDDSFGKLFPGQAFPHLSGRQAAVNAALARELGVKAGDSTLVDVDKQGAAPSGTLFAHRSPEDTLRTLRLNVTAILPDLGVGGFRLDVGTDTPRNVFVSREWLAAEIDKVGLANALLAESDPYDLRTRLASSCTLADYGLRVAPNPSQGYVSLQSARMLLTEPQLEAGRRAAREIGADSSSTSVYLATQIRNSKHSIAYSVVAALSGNDVNAKNPISEVDDDGVVLNSWAADDLRAKVGERLELTYLVPQPDGAYRDARIERTLRAIVDLSGPAADRGIVPEFEGITNAKRIDEWKPPFPIDLGRVTKRDETYWRRYKTTPRAYVSLKTARMMWQSAPRDVQTDWVTSLRIEPKQSIDMADLKQRFEGALARRLLPEDSGMVFRPIRRTALASAAGTTDFGQLFLAMSFFLMLSGAGLAGMLMRLSAQRRAAEIGVMLASGFKPTAAAMVVFGEGLALTILGTLIGLPLGVLYAWGMIAALRSWWVGAVGTSALWLHVTPGSILAGALAGVIVGSVSCAWAILKLRRASALQLLSGWQAMGVLPEKRRNRLNTAAPVTLIAVAAALVLLSAAGRIGSTEGFFGSGAALLLAGIAAINLLLTKTLRARMNVVSLSGLAARSAAANKGRSLLIVGLLACAAFIIVAVAANTRDFSRADYTKRDSGTGGFALRAISSMPIRYDLGSPKGRGNLGFSPEDEKAFDGIRVMPFLMSSGEDISCLNLAKPSFPRVLGVSEGMIARGGFNVITKKEARNPWTLLDNVGKPTPVFGDASSVTWNLHSGLGGVCALPGGTGMRFEGLIPGSIFASELLMSEEYFRKAFPGITEPRYFLFDVPRGREEAVAQALRRNLGRMGLEVRTTREILNAFTGVQNAYLSMFLALGGLGVILGTVGLIAVLLRSALERRGEFALMLTQGFSRADLSRLLIAENAGLLFCGLILGTISALVAVAPELTAVSTRINWSAITAVLSGMLVVGLASCLIAAQRVVSGPLIEALRGE